MREGLGVFMCFAAVVIGSVKAQTPRGSVYYLGQLDGFAGSLTSCTTLACTNQLSNAAQNLSSAIQNTKTPGSILIGMGDNFPQTRALTSRLKWM